MSPAPDIDAALRRRCAAIEQAIARLPAMEERHARASDEAAAAEVEAEAALAAALVPALDDELALSRTAAVLGLPALDPERVRRGLQARREALEASLARLAEEAKGAGLPAALDEARGRAVELAAPLASLNESVSALESDEDFKRFFAQRADERWWTLSFHRARAAGERAFERHGRRRGSRGLEELTRRYESEREALATLRGELQAAEREGARLAALARSLLDTQDELAGLEASLLQELRRVAGGCARLLPEEELLRRLEGAALAEGRRLSGCRARRRYLEAISAHWLERTRADLMNRLQSAQLGLTHGAGLGAITMPSARQLDSETQKVEAEAAKRLSLYEATAERLLAFRAWDRCDPLAGDLWWEHFTGGLVDGSFIDEVTWHHTMRRAPVARVGGGSVDRRQTWQSNAESAQAALAEAHAELRAAAAAPAPVRFDDEQD